jgi:transposase InsO family protein
MEQFTPTRSMSAKGRPPGNAAAGGFLGRMKVEAVHPEQWEERARDEVLALIDECIHWRNHERIKQSLDWKSSAQHRINQGTAA